MTPRKALKSAIEIIEENREDLLKYMPEDCLPKRGRTKLSLHEDEEYTDKFNEALRLKKLASALRSIRRSLPPSPVS